jgi:MerR family transcriptional regulator, light-induced transcriptional regulator
VSESSLKRWADEGRLAVERTAGGHRRIALEEVIRFIRRSGMTPVRPELLGLKGALLGDRAAEARSLIVALYIDGESLAWICDEVIRSALSGVGELWKHDPGGIFLEHRAIETCSRALSQLRSLLPQAGEEAPVAVGGAFDGDVYQVPSAMAALVLAEAGYRERNLGAVSPVAATLAAIRHHQPRIVWQSFSVAPHSIREAKKGLASIADAMGDAALVIGGRASQSVPLPDRSNVHRLGSMAELAAFARGAVSPPR